MVWELTELFGKSGEKVFNSSNNILVGGPQQSLHERCYNKAIGVTDFHPLSYLSLSTYLLSCLHVGFSLIRGKQISVTQLFELQATCNHLNFFT